MKFTVLPLTTTALVVACVVNVQTQDAPTTLPHPPAPSLSSVEMTARSSATLPREPLRKLRAEELRKLAEVTKPHSDDIEKYREFLISKATGIVRLFPDADCVQQFVVRVDGDCAGHVPGASGFNIRKGAESGPDIRLNQTRLVADGFFSSSLLVNLGDVPIESIDVDSVGMKFLMSFQPDNEVKNVKLQNEQIQRGVTADGFFYSDRIEVAANMTFATRIIAFEGVNTSFKRFDRDRDYDATTKIRARFSSLKYDRRSDVIAIFRIVRVDDDRSVTLIWKKLREIDAPKLRFTNSQPLSDLK